MANIVLGKTPEKFAPVVVKFQAPDGSECAVKVVFKYRTRSGFGEMMNKMFSDAGEDKTEGTPDFKELFTKMGDKNADHLMAALESWNLDFELTRENLLALSNQYQASSGALMAAYRDACVEGKLTT